MQIGELRPDRIALYAYAHLPERFKPQRRIADADLPSAAQRIAMLGDAIAGFLSQDYCYIGMDHFALPDDALAVAKREGRLHRNFQGYSTQPDCDLVALGVSAIGRVGAAYYQNAKTLPEYYESLEPGTSAGRSRLRLDARRRIAARRHHGPDVPRSTGFRVHRACSRHSHAGLLRARARGHAGAWRESGLVDLEAAAVQVTSAGWFLVRAIAMVFDQPPPSGYATQPFLARRLTPAGARRRTTGGACTRSG